MSKKQINKKGRPLFIRITAPYFVAGVEYRIGHKINGKVYRSNRCAPIIHYMKYWIIGKIIRYCKSKNWNIEVLN